MRTRVILAAGAALFAAACGQSTPEAAAPEPPPRPEALGERLIDCAGVTAALEKVDVFRGPEQFTPEAETSRARYYWLMMALLDKETGTPDEKRTLVEASRLRWADQPGAAQEERLALCESQWPNPEAAQPPQ